jgi:hypothetical protein
MSNEDFVRRAYEIAEVKDIPGWIACFNPDGVFVDQSVGVRYTGPDEVAKPVENYGRAFSDMHRELYEAYVSGDVVVVELALQGTHDGPLWLPQGMLFDCYPSGTVILGQLGVLGNLGAVLEPEAAPTA